MKIKKDILWRIYLVFGFIALFGLTILFQAFRIQTMEGKYWVGLADSLHTEVKSIEAERGNIFSEDGRLLATSLPFFEIRMDVATPALTKNIFENNLDSLAFCLSNFFQDKTEKEYRDILRKARRAKEHYLLIQRKVNYTQLLSVKKFPLFNLGKYKGGLIVVQRNDRTYPFRVLAKRTIGYVREGVQSIGLEGTYNSELAGVQGKQLMQKIAGGIWIPIDDENEIEPKDGTDIITTIDINLQDVAENALHNALVKHNADHGCAILMEVQTGKIKAIANLGKSENGEYLETYNYAIGESTEPGSTFKLASMIVMIEDGLVNITDTVDIENGVKQYFDLTMKDSEKHDLRKVTVKEAFEHSSNVGISKLVFQNYENSPKAFINHLYEIGLNKKTTIEIDGEPLPEIKKPGDKVWSRTSLPFMSIGYELKLTPLQTLSLFNAVANGGKMMKPYLVNETQQYGKTKKTFEAEILNKKICSEKTLEKICILLEGVVEEGTAKGIKSPNYKIAGKTGTAKFTHSNKEIYQASFAGYFPAERPMYSCIVVVNAPSNGVYYGGAVAAPVFKEIADKVIATKIEIYDPVNRANNYQAYKTAPVAKPGNREEVEKIYNTLGISFSAKSDSINGDWVYCSPKDNSIELKGKKIWKGYVPDVSGMGLKDAMQILEESGLTVKVNGKGKVKNQSLQFGTQILFKGQQIIIELG